MLRIAFLTPTLPWPTNTGGTLRTYHLLRALAAEHAVALFSFHYGAPSDPGSLTTFCHQVTQISLGEVYSCHRQWIDLVRPLPRSVTYFFTKASQQTLLEQTQLGYDLVICDEVILASYLYKQHVRGKPQNCAIPQVLLRQKIDHLHYAEVAAQRPWGMAKLLDQLEAWRLRDYERHVLPIFQAAVVCSAEDGAITQEQCRMLRVDVIPNGADTRYFCPPTRATRNQAPTILLLGTMHYYPNIDAVHYFFETIFPQLQHEFPDLQILIVGHQPPPEVVVLGELPGVTVTGSVEDVRPYIARSWLMAVPLRLGGGTRLKITEAMAAGLPVVSTSMGAEGLAVQHERDLLLADEPTAFAAAIRRLLNDTSLRQQLAEAGRKLVESHYSWAALGQRFVATCEAIIQEHCKTENSQ